MDKDKISQVNIEIDDQDNIISFMASYEDDCGDTQTVLHVANINEQDSLFFVVIDYTDPDSAHIADISVALSDMRQYINKADNVYVNDKVLPVESIDKFMDNITRKNLPNCEKYSLVNNFNLLVAEQTAEHCVNGLVTILSEISNTSKELEDGALKVSNKLCGILNNYKNNVLESGFFSKTDLKADRKAFAEINYPDNLTPQDAIRLVVNDFCEDFDLPDNVRQLMKSHFIHDEDDIMGLTEREVRATLEGLELDGCDGISGLKDYITNKIHVGETFLKQGNAELNEKSYQPKSPMLCGSNKI